MMITKSAFAIYAAGFGNMDAADNVQLVWLCIPLTTGLGSHPFRVFPSALYLLNTLFPHIQLDSSPRASMLTGLVSSRSRIGFRG